MQLPSTVGLAARSVAQRFRASILDRGIAQSAATRSASAMGSEGPPSLQPQEAKQLLDGEKAAVLIDVRTPEEYAQGAVPGSINVPIKLDDGTGKATVDNPDFVAQATQAVPKDAALVCTCAHGRRGGLAAAALAEAGHGGGVLNLAGGLAAWSDAGLPHEGQIKRHH